MSTILHNDVTNSAVENNICFIFVTPDICPFLNLLHCRTAVKNLKPNHPN